MVKQTQYFLMRLASFLLLLALFYGLVGFIKFCHHVNQMTPPQHLPYADGLIVLTGGHNRLQPALELLEKNYGKRLLISGVNPAIEKKELIRVTHSSDLLFNERVDLGHEADNTASNALESAHWIAKHHYHSVYLITNDYHMPRSLAELHAILPNTHFILYPIKDKQGHKLWESFSYKRIKLLFSEYLKYLGVSLKQKRHRYVAHLIRIHRKFL